MGYSGLIYAAIVAAWLAVLVPRWVRRNEEVEQARETDAVNGVRVLRPRSRPVHAAHRLGVDGRTILSADPAGMLREAATADSADQPRSADVDAGRVPAMAGGARPQDHASSLSTSTHELELTRMDQAFAHAARRRRLMLSVLLLTTVTVTATALLGPVPVWAPAISGVVLGGFLVAARRAAVTQARRRADLWRRLARQRAAEPDPAEVEAPPVTDDGKRVAILDVPDVAEAPAEDTWEPVDVPLPTYVTKPKAPRRIARKIDLDQAGSWTSGRLEPDKSFDLPTHHRGTPVVPAAEQARAEASTQAPAQDDEVEDMPEKRRAVGE